MKLQKYLLEEIRDINWYANEIEDMDLNVEKADRAKFDRVLNAALKKIDPKNNLDIASAVKKMGLSKARALLDDLLDFHYEE